MAAAVRVDDPAASVATGASARTPPRADTAPTALTPTDRCPQADIDTLQRVTTFVRAQSWAEQPGSTAFLLNPDTSACRVVLTIEANRLSDAETAALRRGGENRLSIEERKDRAEPSRLPLLLWLVFGGTRAWCSCTPGTAGVRGSPGSGDRQPGLAGAVGVVGSRAAVTAVGGRPAREGIVPVLTEELVVAAASGQVVVGWPAVEPVGTISPPVRESRPSSPARLYVPRRPGGRRRPRRRRGRRCRRRHRWRRCRPGR